MREIKFRAWDIRNKKYYTPVFIAETEVHAYVGHYGLDCVGDISEFIIEQYTGLKDKNGVEIYEGDVALYTDKSNQTDKVGVYFENGTFLIFKGLAMLALHLSDLSKLEIIGNIHEEETNNV